MLGAEENFLMMLYRAGLDPISEERLASSLGVTPAIIRQTCEELRRLGFHIDAHPQRGYRLIDAPDRLVGEDLQARLRAIHPGEWPSEFHIGNRILVFEETNSTMDVIQRLANENHSEGLVVFAEAQSAGRGRQGKGWISPSRKGLWFSILLRPQLSLQSVSRLMVMVAVAVTKFLQKVTGLPLRIKWPNDILCNGRKVAGILVESETDDQQIRHAVIGIGINVNLEAADFPDDLRSSATSLKMEAGRSFHRPALAAEVLHGLNQYRELLSDERFPFLLEQWVGLDDTLGRQISISGFNGRELRGLAMNLDPDGALLLRTDEGCVERVMAGDVTLGIS